MAKFFNSRDSMLAAGERILTGFMQGAYKLWLAAVRAAVLMPYNRFRLAPDPNGVWVAEGIWRQQIDAMMPDLVELARHGWMDAAADVGFREAFDPSSGVLADQLQRTRNLLVRTSNETYRDVVAELAKGGTVDEQAARVRALLEYSGAENWPSRGRTVAVTEVNRAYNMGGLAAALRAEGDLGRLLKRWDARRDEATRAGHRRAHGQTVPVSQPFQVSGEALMVPGDPSGSPSNVINCRCLARYSRSQ